MTTDHYRPTPPTPLEVLAHSGVTQDGWRRGWQIDDDRPQDWVELRVIDGDIRGWHHGPGGHFYAPEGWGANGEWGWDLAASCSAKRQFRPVLISPAGDVVVCEWPLDAEGFQSFPPSDAQREQHAYPWTWRFTRDGVFREWTGNSASALVRNWQPGDKCKPMENV